MESLSTDNELSSEETLTLDIWEYEWIDAHLSAWLLLWFYDPVQPALKVSADERDTKKYFYLLVGVCVQIQLSSWNFAQDGVSGPERY